MNSSVARASFLGPVLGLAVLGVSSVPLEELAAQGWIEPLPPLAGGFAVDRVKSEVRVNVEGPVAFVEVTEWFLNDGSRIAEGDYLYPLPGEAAFEEFSLYQGDEEFRGEIMDAGEARSIYEDIVRRRKDPALIEYAGYGLLRARVFPIEAGEERKVTIRYVQRLDRSGSGYRIVHAGALRSGEPELAPRAGGEEAPELRPLPEPVDASFEIRVAEGAEYHDPFSPTHEIDFERRSDQLFVRVADFGPNQFVLFLPLAENRLGVTVATHNPATEDGYFMLTLSPGNGDGESEAVPRDVTAVLDVSGSMAGTKIEQARRALHQLLGSLGRRDRFRLVAFSNRVLATGGDWQSWSSAEVERAREWVDGLVANGGTDIGAALEEALRLESPADRLPVVVFLTDGLPTNGETSPERIADRAEAAVGRARIFAFGVGNDVNTHLLDRLGEAGRGSTDYVASGEDVERVVGELVLRVSHPALTDLTVRAESARFTEIYPVRIPDVFMGQELVLFGRFAGTGGGSVTVGGRRGSEELEYRADVEFPRSDLANGYIPRLWAARKLGHLQRQIWIEGESPELVEAIRELALRYGLPSRYTSYLVREPVAIATDLPMSVAPPAGRAPVGGVAATGQAAVAAARQAGRLRIASRAFQLDEAAEAVVAINSQAASEPSRTVGGRTFVAREGTWMDVAHRPERESVVVELYGDVYFALARELPEIAPVLKELARVVIAGAGISLRFTDEPDSVFASLDADELRKVVRAFRDARD